MTGSRWGRGMPDQLGKVDCSLLPPHFPLPTMPAAPQPAKQWAVGSEGSRVLCGEGHRYTEEGNPCVIWGQHVGSVSVVMLTVVTQSVRDRTQSPVVILSQLGQRKTPRLGTVPCFAFLRSPGDPKSLLSLYPRKMGSQHDVQPLSPVPMSQKRRLRQYEEGSCLCSFQCLCWGDNETPVPLFSFSWYSPYHHTTSLHPRE